MAAATGSTHSTTTTSMLDHHYWRELSRLVDAFRQVGKMGGKATLTSSTENGLWRASLDIQTNPSPAAQPGLASTPTPHSAAPNQDGAAGRCRPDNAGTQPQPFGHKNEPGLTRPLWQPEDKAPLRCPPESQKAKIFRIARFLSHKLSR